MVMPPNNVSPIRGDLTRVNAPQMDTTRDANVSGGVEAFNPNRSVTAIFDRYRLEAIRQDNINTDTSESNINTLVGERDDREAVREAYDPWVSLLDAAAAEAMVLQFTRTARTPSGIQDSFYVARRNTNDNDVQEVDNPNSTPNLQDSTLEANNQERTAMYQNMVQNQVVNQSAGSQAHDSETRERYERIQNLYNNTRILGRLFDRRA